MRYQLLVGISIGKTKRQPTIHLGLRQSSRTDKHFNNVQTIAKGLAGDGVKGYISSSSKDMHYRYD